MRFTSPIAGAMRIGGLLLLLGLAITTVGTVERPNPSNLPHKALSEELQQLKTSANQFLIEGDFVGALPLYEKGFQIAASQRDNYAKARFLHGLGNCSLLSADYRAAIARHLEAKKLASADSDWVLVSLLSMNLFTAYSRMGNFTAAFESMQDVLRRYPSVSLKENLPRMLLNMATAQSLAGNSRQALSLFSDAINASEEQLDFLTLASTWSELGSHHFRQGNLVAADRAFTRDFYVRRVFGTRGLANSYNHLGMLRVAQGEPESALVLLNAGIDVSKRFPVGFPALYLYFHRANARLALDDLPGAFDDFASALDLAGRWRLDVLGTDSSQTGAEVSLQKIYAGYIETGMRLYVQNHSAGLAYAMFQATEENRAVSFREQLLAEKNFPAEYWQTLANLKKAEMVLYGRETAAQRRLVGQLRLQLSELESQLQVPSGNSPSTYSHRINENYGSVNSLTPFQGLITDQEALMSFHSGEKQSYLWAFTREGFEVHSLPGRARVLSAVRALQESVRTGSPNAHAQARALYRDLFGNLAPNVANKRSWLLVLDDTLVELPFPALVISPESGNPKYLIERNSLRLLPSAEMLRIAPRASATGPFVGIGDPIYNRADPRWGAAPVKFYSWRSLQATFQFAQEAIPEMTRLVGSGQEVRTAAAAWQSPQPPILLEGRSARRSLIEQELKRGPSVAHFATHVVQPVNQPDQAMIAIGLDAAGEPDFLTISEVSNWRYSLGLVALSGCSSGTGKALPGAGLFGLTRAWLLAGANAVVASQWPTPDDSGPLFKKFYESFRPPRPKLSSASAADALRTAQIEMLRSGTWRAEPRFWAAFFVVGKD